MGKSSIGPEQASMTSDNSAPFSARVRAAHRQIDNDFPVSARVGLRHLLYELVRRRYVEGWGEVARELARIARVPPSEVGPRGEQEAETILEGLSWERVYDFCERLHNHLAQDVVDTDFNGNERLSTPRSGVQAFIASELRRLFLEEALAFDFGEGVVQRRDRRHSVERISRAEVVLGDPRLGAARKHYEKALQFFRDPSKPDHENAVKEAVCSVEAAGKALFPEAKAATLGDLTKWLTSTDTALLPKTLGQTIVGLYGFRGGGDGVSHGGASGGVATAEIAEYALAVTASQIILLVDLSNSQEQDIPF